MSRDNPEEHSERDLSESEKSLLNEQFNTVREEVTKEDVAYVLSKADSTAERLKESTQGWIQLLGKQITLLWELLSDWWNDRYEVPWKVVAAITAALLYMVNPWDLIPDVLPIVGWVDDAMVMKLCYNLIKSDLREYARQRDLNPSEYGL